MNGRRFHQRGISIVELLTASVVAGALVVLVTQMLLAAALQHQAAQRRLLAMNELANVAERVAAMKYDDINDEQLSAIELTAPLTAALPEAKLTFDLHPEADPPAGKRIAMAIVWGEADGGAGQSLRLTTWRFAREEK